MLILEYSQKNVYEYKDRGYKVLTQWKLLGIETNHNCLCTWQTNFNLAFG